MRPTKRTMTAGLLSLALLGAALAATTIGGSGKASASINTPGDGLTQGTAGASCWGIKQQFPASTDGVYWLLTGHLQFPQQFYCDMTTDGGGWVLVGRGRNSWNFSPDGQGSASAVRTTPTGTGAFTPAALSDATITGLLDGGSVTALPDGIRVKRAANSTGTSWQELRLHTTQPVWSWAFGGGIITSSISIDGTTYQGSNTRDTQVKWAGQTTNGLAGADGTRRLFTYPWTGHNLQDGFSYGAGVNGASTSSTNYLWEYNREGDPLPFAQVWLRPELANSSIPSTPIPATGFTAVSLPADLKDKPELNSWGVSGDNATGDQASVAPGVSVLALKAIGNRIFVGGRFTTVNNGSSGPSYPQSFLAAFDRTTGAWISDFRPTLNGRVYALEASPQGQLIVGGDFTNINGTSNSAALAELDPITGAVNPGFKANLVHTASGTHAIVRALAVSNGYVFAAGKFNQLTGGTWNTITVDGLVKVNTATGTPFNGFGTAINGDPASVAVTPDGSRVLIGGQFGSINSNSAGGYFGVLDANTGSIVSGLGAFQPSTTRAGGTYEQTVGAFGNKIFTGGSEHHLQMYDANRNFITSHITRNGGDYQAMAFVGGKLYGTCHCANWDYQGTNDYLLAGPYQRVDPVKFIAQYDPTTLDHNPDWYPGGLKGQADGGGWALTGDDSGCLWFGGDFTRESYSGTSADYIGNFGRFCPEDTTPPTAPTAVTGAYANGNVNLSWKASTDDQPGAVQYWIYRNDHVVGTTYGTNFTDPGVTGNASYAVRAVDVRGNESATGAPLNLSTPASPTGVLVAKGSTWQYKDDGTDQGTAWQAPGFDSSAWASGAGVLGWGKTQATTIGATHPITTYFRKTFTVADPSTIRTLALGALVDDGAVVYLNGHEVTRINMPAGQPTATTLASAYTTGSQESTYRPFTIPASFLTTGTNTLAVEVHQAVANNNDGLFDLTITGYGPGGDAKTPTAPVLTGTAAIGSTALSWTPSSDDVAVAGYLIQRDGTTIAFAPSPATTWTDPTVAAGPHTYVVSAVDTNGNATASNSLPITSPAPSVSTTLVAKGATWKYKDDGTDQGTAWQAPNFDDSTWSSGPAVLGWGKNPVTAIGPTHPVTTYFRSTFNVTDATQVKTLDLSALVDDGAVIYVNGTEVARVNMAAGTPTYTTLASAYTSGSQETTYRAFTVPPSVLQTGSNTIAVEVHQAQVNNADCIFDAQLIAST